MRPIHCLIGVVALGLTACASGQASRTASAGIDPSALAGEYRAQPVADYRIGPTDLLSVTVFQVPDLTFPEIRVDASGYINMPLIRTVQVAGLTPAELSRDLERRLGERYLKDPQVNVIVKEAASEKIIVDGAVVKPGAYQMRGRTTLLQAVAMAEGPTRTAEIRTIVVFRRVDGERMVAQFDLGAIRRGEAEDPVVLGEDVVIVDESQLKAVWRDLLMAAPLFNVFRNY